MYTKQIHYSQEFMRDNLDAMIYLTRANLDLVPLWIKLDNNKMTVIRKIKEIKLTLDVCNASLGLAEACLRKLEFDGYLSPDVVLQYRETISKTRARISEVTKRILGE